MKYDIIKMVYGADLAFDKGNLTYQRASRLLRKVTNNCKI